MIDLGANLKPQSRLRAFEQYNLSAVAVSCVRNECVDGLQALLATLNEASQNLAVVIGEIVVNKVAASKLLYESPPRHTREGGEHAGMTDE